MLRFTALPEHVRIARLVTTSLARRAGLSAGDVEGVRLAVGEACGRAVQRSESAATSELVEVTSTSSAGTLVVEVVDHAGDDGVETEEVAMLLMEGLADEVAVTAGPGGRGGTTRLTWRAAGGSLRG
ncbi:Anti-sigma regulatory factor (Ser/Thr protein kinase) [Quadrisphaera granulorum]|uniref:Anti-sigma regulatory factor (Ser/Thr protein kinase) n=1 Tax=Quadrisphaera granulorum TaxID=317664 RepID=A0A316A6W8_9ACTN|nr:anti-sigma regulatory factor (Ser/Thr protein kinase) [Quadrisphaera granulorum]SZE97007.1 Anti-sigma regulatory factor (Ser/Thr protein kinase) [Quadrisphaera granulorum]